MLSLHQSHRAAPLPRPPYQPHSRILKRSQQSRPLPRGEGGWPKVPNVMTPNGLVGDLVGSGLGPSSRRPPHHFLRLEPAPGESGGSGTCHLKFPKPASRRPASKIPANAGYFHHSHARLAGMAGMAAILRLSVVTSQTHEIFGNGHSAATPATSATSSARCEHRRPSIAPWASQSRPGSPPYGPQFHPVAPAQRLRWIDS